MSVWIGREAAAHALANPTFDWDISYFGERTKYSVCDLDDFMKHAACHVYFLISYGGDRRLLVALGEFGLGLVVNCYVRNSSSKAYYDEFGPMTFNGFATCIPNQTW
jgi:hypothetical protein